MNRKTESGMTLIEVMLAAFIITVSLLAIAMTMGAGINAMFIVQEQLIAKQKAREAMESVFTARSTQNIAFSDIRGLAAEGIFYDDWQPIREMGLDGIANTEDDGDLEEIAFPGEDGELGTGDDERRPLANFERKITFSDVLTLDDEVDEEIRKITVDVRFQIRGRWYTVSVSSYISKFA
jgi:type II secretory pathway pseudopilin PulG